MCYSNIARPMAGFIRMLQKDRMRERELELLLFLPSDAKQVLSS
jgi:hypothetical protein